MLIVMGEAEAAPGRRVEMVDALSAMAAATRSDDGCVSYGFYADVTRPEMILGIEVWRDRAALDAHMSHDHTAAFIATVPGLVAGSPVMRFFDADPVSEKSR